MIIPAILTDSLRDFRKKMDIVSEFSSWVQIDIMDGIFVPNRSVTLREILGSDMRGLSLEMHLMTENPSSLFPLCEKLGASRVISHVEAVESAESLFRAMEPYSFQKGIALNPTTVLSRLSRVEGKFHEVLFLGVDPGFQGQEFQEEVKGKVREFLSSFPGVKAGIDGGVNESNIKELAALGLEYVNVGSSLFSSEDPKRSFLSLQEKLQVP